MSEEEGQLIGAISESEELRIFETDLIREVIDFKWDAFAAKQHRFGACIHLCYLIILIMYINDTFLEKQPVWADDIKVEDRTVINRKEGPKVSPGYLCVVFVCLLYPTFYDGTQACK